MVLYLWRQKQIYALHKQRQSGTALSKMLCYIFKILQNYVKYPVFMTILKFMYTYWLGQTLIFHQAWGCDSFFGIRIQQISGDENRASFWRQSIYFIDILGNILYSGLLKTPVRKMYAVSGTFLNKMRYEQHKYSKQSEILYQMPQSKDKESSL